MFDIASTELLLVAVVALLVIGPKDLPRLMRTVGHWIGRARGVARHFRSGIDAMIREAELEEIERHWTTENERIMREHPQLAETERGPEPEGGAEPGPSLELPLPLPPQSKRPDPRDPEPDLP